MLIVLEAFCCMGAPRIRYRTQHEHSLVCVASYPKPDQVEGDPSLHLTNVSLLTSEDPPLKIGSCPDLT